MNEDNIDVTVFFDSGRSKTFQVNKTEAIELYKAIYNTEEEPAFLYFPNDIINWRHVEHLEFKEK